MPPLPTVLGVSQKKKGKLASTCDLCVRPCQPAPACALPPSLPLSDVYEKTTTQISKFLMCTLKRESAAQRNPKNTTAPSGTKPQVKEMKQRSLLVRPLSIAEPQRKPNNTDKSPRLYDLPQMHGCMLWWDMAFVEGALYFGQAIA